MRGTSPPNPYELLPPILACLPTAFASPRPPPALLPLLSPILRQRVHLLSDSSSSSSVPSQRPQQPSAGWLRLLTWSPERAGRLEDIVSKLQLEPHPVSGELELFGDGDEEGGKIWYKRRDEESLEARCDVREHRIGVVWLWCTNDGGGIGLKALEGDQVGQASDGWRVAEVLPLEKNDHPLKDGFHESIAAADQAGSRPASVIGWQEQRRQPNDASDSGSETSENQSDDYWASYDRTPAQTPNNLSRQASSQVGPRGSGDQEQDYFARYGSEVQPAMDGHDPDEERPGQESTLHGGGVSLSGPTSPQLSRTWRLSSSHNSLPDLEKRSSQPNDTPTNESVATRTRGDTIRPVRSQDLPYIPSRNSSMSSASPAVAALQRFASGSTLAETGVKNHISTEIKSLFRLAQSVGMERGEFEWVVRTELELLGLVEL